MTDTTNVGGIAAEKLKSFIERIERIERLNVEKDEKARDIREVYSESKGSGFDTKIMRKIIALRKLDTALRNEQGELTELYRRAVGV